MARAKLTNVVKAPKAFTDVLYVTSHQEMPPEIRQLLKQRKLSFSTQPVDKFHQICDRLDLIGTVIIDTESLDVLQQQKLARIIELLQMKNIGAILLGNRARLPVKSFALAGSSVKSFSLATTVNSVSVDELEDRIDDNLAYRHKKSSGIAGQVTAPPRQTKSTYGNKIAEQLSVTEALVDNMAEQLRIAGLVQRDFLPRQLPNSDQLHWATIFLPAEWVSGDIYDIVRIDEQHIGFYVADVVGHGMPAALLTIFLKQALVMRETMENNYRIFSPGEVMANLNLRLTAQKLSGQQFATCCYCLLNIKTLQLTYARAGHPYPVLIRPDQAPKQLEIGGSLMGIFEQTEHSQQTIQLQPGDKLLLYSDGTEPFIGGFDELTGFNFNKEFCEIRDLPIVEMMNKFSELIKIRETKPAELDDITVIGLEIL